MSPYRLLLLRSLRHHLSSPSPSPSPSLLFHRSFAFSSAEEAAAERRRRKRRLRIEPPLHALRRDPSAPPPPRDPNAPRLPDSTSALVGARLSLHNRVQSLIRAFDLDAASVVARHSVFSSTRPTVFTCNAIIASMYRAKRYEDAIALFHFFFNQSNIVPNVVSYNNLINTHCDMGNVDKGLEIYRHIIDNAPFGPSSVTYRHLTKGLIDTGRIDEALDLLMEMLNKGHGADSLVYNNLIKGLLELGNLTKAEDLFDELNGRCLVYDGVVNATFMEWYFKQGKDTEALESYRSLLDRKFRMVPATSNVLLEVLLKYGKKNEAWDMFERMLDDHTPPTFQAVNSDTFNLMVNECFKEGKVDEALATFRKVGTKATCRPFIMDVAGYNNMIVRYCEHGMLVEGYGMYQELISKSLCPDATSHRSLIEGYLKAERFKDAVIMFHKMVDSNLRVVASFGNKVFGDLIKNQMTADCARILTEMSEKDPKPDPSCYEIVLKGLCNEKALDEASNLIELMVKHGIGFTPSLREVLTASFGEAGRREEIDRQLNALQWGYVPRYPPQRGPPRGGMPLNLPSAGPQFFRSPPNSPSQMHNSMPPGPTQGVGLSQIVETRAPSQVTGSPYMSQISSSPYNNGVHAPPQANVAPNYYGGQGAPSQMSGPWEYSQAPGVPYMSQTSEQCSPSPYGNGPHSSHQVNVTGSPYMSQTSLSPYNNGVHAPPQANVAPNYYGGQGAPSQMSGPWEYSQAPGAPYMSRTSEQCSPSPYGNGPHSSHQVNVASPHNYAGQGRPFQAAGSPYVSQISGQHNPSSNNNGWQRQVPPHTEVLHSEVAGAPGSISHQSNEQQEHQQRNPSEFAHVTRKAVA